MDSTAYQFEPIQKTRSIPVRWEFSQEDYDKLAKGYRSNWSVFMRGDMVHVCRIGGEEFYRFTITESGDTYTTNKLEAYIPDDFYESARQRGWTEEKIEQHQAELRGSVVEETVGLLVRYFDIHV